MPTRPLISFVTAPTACEYLRGEERQLRIELMPGLDAAEYMERMRQGWRRFGASVFQPACTSCRRCESLRVPVDAFAPSPTQRRVWRKGAAALTLTVGTPSITAEKIRLLTAFHEYGHEAKGWPSATETDLTLFVDNPFPTEEWSYRIDGRLVGVGYVDALPDALSAIYFFHDPAEHRRSLGVFNVLAIIAAARARRLPHAYLGYYVEGSRSMAYKAAFRPHERLVAGEWTRSGD